MLGQVHALPLEPEAPGGVGRQPDGDPLGEGLGDQLGADMVEVIVGDEDGVDALDARRLPERAGINQDPGVAGGEGHAGVVVLGQGHGSHAAILAQASHDQHPFLHAPRVRPQVDL